MKNKRQSGPRCFSCDKELWPPNLNGYLLLVDGDHRCDDCKNAGKSWLPKYLNT